MCCFGFFGFTKRLKHYWWNLRRTRWGNAECSTTVLPVGGANKGLALGDRGAELRGHSEISWTQETTTKTGQAGAVLHRHFITTDWWGGGGFTAGALQPLCTVVLCVSIYRSDHWPNLTSPRSVKRMLAPCREHAQIDYIHRNTHTHTHIFKHTY